MRNNFFCVVLIFCLGLSSAAQTIPNNNRLKTKLDQFVHQSVLKLMAENPKIGLSIGVYQNGKISRYHYGTIAKGVTKLPNDATVYEIASLTKTFTGALLAKAISEQKISLTDDIRQYLKEAYPNLEYEGKFISIRDLETHQSGLPRNIPYDAKMWAKPDFDTLPFELNQIESGYTVQDWLKELHGIELTKAPGSIEFEYSNIGINLIAVALENVYGKSYEQMISEWILKPLKMRETKFAFADVNQANLAKGYNDKGKEMPYLLDNARAAGGLKSSLKDMLKYVAFQMDESKPMPKISHQSIRINQDRTFGIGLGWQTFNPNEKTRAVFEDGGSYGFSNTIILYPDENLGFVILSNESGPNSQGKLHEAVEKIKESILEDKSR